MVMLVAAVVATLGISVSQKTVLETKIDIDEEALKQAFSSAESGIEYYFGSGQTPDAGSLTYTSPDGKSRALVEVAALGSATEINYDSPVVPGGYEYYWMAGHNEDGSLNLAETYGGSRLKVCVSNGDSSLVEVALFYLTGGEYAVERQVLNFDDVEVKGVARTSHDDCGGYGLGATINLAAGTKVLLAVSPLAVSTNMKVVADGGVFPSQGNVITAVGEVLNDGASSPPVRSRVAVQDRYKLLPFLLNPVTGAKRVLSQ